MDVYKLLNNEHKHIRQIYQSTLTLKEKGTNKQKQKAKKKLKQLDKKLKILDEIQNEVLLNEYI